jgi:hypothetical protein
MSQTYQDHMPPLLREGNQTESSFCQQNHI